MNKYLVNTPPISLFPDLATAIGLNESIILQQVHYWTYSNEQAKRNFEDGYYWTYNTYKGWKKQFPFWTERTIQRIIYRLEKSGLLIIGNFNKVPLDQTKWYRINYDKLKEILDSPNGELDSPNGEAYEKPIPTPYDSPNGETTSTKCRDGFDKMSRPLPDTIITNIKNIYSPYFETFWEAYPRKEDKKQAFVCWNARLKDGVGPEVMIQAARTYAERCREERKEKKFIKLAKTFIGPNCPFEEWVSQKALSEESEFAEYGVSNLGWLPDPPTEEEEEADRQRFLKKMEKIKSGIDQGLSAKEALEKSREVSRV